MTVPGSGLLGCPFLRTEPLSLPKISSVSKVHSRLNSLASCWVKQKDPAEAEPSIGWER
jgi:hypothetical protein